MRRPKPRALWKRKWERKQLQLQYSVTVGFGLGRPEVIRWPPGTSTKMRGVAWGRPYVTCRALHLGSGQDLDYLSSSQ